MGGGAGGWTAFEIARIEAGIPRFGADMDETNIPNVSMGQPARISIDALPDRTLSGTVAFIRTKFEEKRGDITYTVTIAVGEVPVQARWGMTALIVLKK